MNKQHTLQDFASKRVLWEEYIDPDNNAPFAEYTQEEREKMIKDIWPNDFDAKGNPIC